MTFKGRFAPGLPASGQAAQDVAALLAELRALIWVAAGSGGMGETAQLFGGHGHRPRAPARKGRGRIFFRITMCECRRRLRPSDCKFGISWTRPIWAPTCPTNSARSAAASDGHATDGTLTLPHHSITVPPSTAIVCPVTNWLPSPISHATVPVRSDGTKVR